MNYTPETLPDDEQYEEFSKIARTLIEFTPDGNINTLFPVPEEMRAEVEAQGMTIRDDGYFVIADSTWKQENGKFYFDSKISGEILDETIDPFAEIKITPYRSFQ